MGRKKALSERPVRRTAKSAERAEKAPKTTDRAPRVGGYGREYTLFDFGYAADAGASAHYQDPSYYAATYDNRRHDVAYYAQKARLSRGPVLEYGIGNGRVALHVARAGIEIEGIDLSQPMLDDFARRLEQEPQKTRARVRLHAGDMRTLRLGRRFPLVIAPFNAILHLYDRRDFESFFEGVRSHLSEGGTFLFDFSVPQPDDLCRNPAAAFAAPELVHPETGERVTYAERFEYDPLRQILLSRLEFTPQAGSPPFSVPLTQRQIFPREMEALLHYNGFEQILFTADFTDQAADHYVDSIVVSCKARR
ncbi:MAG TPA: class I SAM-dependent methyltransferase [Polyangiaceae bacterium]|nr:class I SAM-dependent methyltransferase [Polyangiaceae bacterium]